MGMKIGIEIEIEIEIEISTISRSKPRLQDHTLLQLNLDDGLKHRADAQMSSDQMSSDQVIKFTNDKREWQDDQMSRDHKYTRSTCDHPIPPTQRQSTMTTPPHPPFPNSAIAPSIVSWPMNPGSGMPLMLLQQSIHL